MSYNISRRRFIQMAAATTAITASPLAFPNIVIKDKRDIAFEMLYSCFEVANDIEEASRRFEPLLSYMLDNFEHPTLSPEEIADIRPFTRSTISVEESRKLMYTMTESAFPVAMVRMVVKICNPVLIPSLSRFADRYIGLFRAALNNMPPHSYSTYY